MSRPVSPVEGYIPYLGNYGMRGGSFHAGVDIAGGGRSRKVYAMFDGVLERIVRNRLPGNLTYDWYAPYRTGNYGGVLNPDGERQLYNHTLIDSRWREGDSVRAGDYLGVTDLSGNTTGEHLHLEIWNKYRKTRNPLIDFRYFGITVGSKPVGVDNDPWDTPTPTPEPPKPTGSSAVRSWQRRQNKYGNAGLYVDGIKGRYSKAWETWVKDAQDALNSWKSDLPDLLVDGDYGATTHRRAAEFQDRNGRRVTGVLSNTDLAFMRKYGTSVRNRPRTRP